MQFCNFVIFGFGFPGQTLFACWHDQCVPTSGCCTGPSGCVESKIVPSLPVRLVPEIRRVGVLTNYSLVQWTLLLTRPLGVGPRAKGNCFPANLCLLKCCYIIRINPLDPEAFWDRWYTLNPRSPKRGLASTSNTLKLATPHTQAHINAHGHTHSKVQGSSGTFLPRQHVNKLRKSHNRWRLFLRP